MIFTKKIWNYCPVHDETKQKYYRTTASGAHTRRELTQGLVEAA